MKPLFAWIALAGLTLAGVLVYRARSHEAGEGTLIDGLDDEGRPIHLRVDWMLPDPKDPEGQDHLYGVSIETDGGWRPYCGRDIEGRSAAIPVAGSFDPARGTFADAGPETFTFACTGGAVGKCLRFGYRPWRTYDGGSLEPLHSACVRLIRADYCGNGHGHTVNGTRIDLYDRVGIQQPEPDSGFTEDFEAGWDPHGATYLRIPRWNDDVAAIVAECPEKLAGRAALDGGLEPDEVVRRFPETLMIDHRMHNSGDRLVHQ